MDRRKTVLPQRRGPQGHAFRNIRRDHRQDRADREPFGQVRCIRPGRNHQHKDTQERRRRAERYGRHRGRGLPLPGRRPLEPLWGNERQHSFPHREDQYQPRPVGRDRRQSVPHLDGYGHGASVRQVLFEHVHPVDDEHAIPRPQAFARLVHRREKHRRGHSLRTGLQFDHAHARWQRGEFPERGLPRKDHF